MAQLPVLLCFLPLLTACASSLSAQTASRASIAVAIDARNSTWRLLLEVTFSVLRFPSNQFSKANSQRRNEMFSTLSTRRGFAGRLAALIPGLSLSGTALPGSAEPQAAAGVQN